MREDKPVAIRRAALAVAVGLLSGCHSAVLDPAGDIALQQRDIIYISTALMLLIIVPVLALIVVFAWRYREGNKDATYDPGFDHSTALELVIWSAPLLIIICLGALTWWSTHLLDPFRPVNRIAAGRPVDPRVRPLVVQVVSLDWKWLFIYPEIGIATVNELALPVDRPVRFDLTSTNMMNTFYAPTLAGMIYTMPGMRSQLHAVLNRPGMFDGMSANYSGAGFSDMHFKLYGVAPAEFDAWVARVKGSGRTLDTTGFLALERPSERVPAMYFGGVEGDLFDRIANRCVRPGTPCIRDMARHHAQPAAPKPDGALFERGSEMPTGSHYTQPPARATPGSTKPGTPENHDMSVNLVPAVPRAPRRGAA